MNFSETIEFALATLEADQVLYIEGPPGVGKSDLCRKVASLLDLPLETLYLSQCDSAEVAGYPVVSEGRVRRLPLGPLAHACEVGCLLFLDELPDAPPPVQAASQSVVLTRKVGESTLHPDTRIICAGNPPDSASGGYGRTLPMVGRMAQSVLIPTLAEISGYMETLGSEGSTLRALALDWSATLGAMPDLLQIQPPPNAATEGKAWGAPRNWERALRVLASLLDRGIAIGSSLVREALSGCVGEACAISWLAILKVRENLPTISEVASDPKNAKVPHDLNTGIASLGIVAQVAQKDACPAWIYVARMSGEAQIAAYRVVLRADLSGQTRSKFFQEATRARVALMGAMGAVR